MKPHCARPASFHHQSDGIRYVGTAQRPNSHNRRWRPALQRCPAYEPEVLPPVPPPPPPPPPRSASQGANRRSVLLGAAGASLASGLLGYLVGSKSSDAPDKKAIDTMRQESGFRRDYAGRVYLQARDGSFYLLRTDAKLPGTVLMRAPDGRVFYMSFNDIQQVDLSDDFVVSGIFGAGAAWEEEMQPLQAKAKDGSMTDVRMKQENFEDMISIISAPD